MSRDIRQGPGKWPQPQNRGRGGDQRRSVANRFQFVAAQPHHPEEGLQADGGFNSSPLWRSCDCAAAWTLWLGSSDCW